MTIKKNISNDDLAMMVARGFAELHGDTGEIRKDMEEVKKDIKEVKDRLGNVEENIKATRRDVLDIGDRFVPRYEFDNLLVRFGRLEQRVLGKRAR